MATPGDSDSPFRPGSAWTALIEHRFAWLAVWDSAAWVVALFLGTWARYEFQADRFEAVDVLLAAAVVVAAQVLLGLWQGLYLGRWRLGSFEEIAALLRTVVLSGVILLLADANPRWVPISVPVIGVFIAIVGMAAIRYGWRLLIERKKRPTGEGIARMLVFGAGEGAEQIITAMLRNPDSPYLPVAIIDDDPRKARLRVRNISVQGTRHQIAQVAANNGADVLLIAVPSADGALVRELAALGENAGLQVMAVPTVSEMLDDQVGIEDIRPLTTADLLGRREIDTDVAGIADYLAGRRVLITGAGGSIGSELCRQVHRFEPAALVMLDRDESALHAVQLSIHGRALLETRDVVVADIRDAARLDEVFAEHRPEVVFHAAALKHLPLCELHPTEAVKTNVWGTASLLELALRHGVATFVNISTDKAADPTSVLGATKRIAERLTAHAAEQSEAEFISVRFGNVLGSRGSVLGSFHAQIEAGGPVTVTDPEVTRFFMTVEEAVQLVIQAGAIGEDGRAMVLDMGEPVKIAEVAKRLIDQAGGGIEIVYTGLRPGEKLHEVLRGDAEAPVPTTHPLIAAVDVPPLDWQAVTGLRGTTAAQLLDELQPHLVDLDR